MKAGCLHVSLRACIGVSAPACRGPTENKTHSTQTTDLNFTGLTPSTQTSLLGTCPWMTPSCFFGLLLLLHFLAKGLTKDVRNWAPALSTFSDCSGVSSHSNVDNGRNDCRVISAFSSREKLYTPPPPLPHFWPEGIFQGRGGGVVYFEAPRGRNFIRPPLLYTPPTPRRVFSGVAGWGCIKIGPVSH